MIKLSTRARRLLPSPTLAVTARAKALRDQGVDVIGFGAGEPDFDTPEHVKQAAAEAMERGETKYTPVGGTPVLKAAIAHRLEEDFGLHYGPSEIVVGCGAKHVLFNLFLALLDPGDEVVIPAPYWVSYPEMVAVAEGKPVVVPTRPEAGFCLDPADLESHLGPRTRALILNSPSNPTGMAYTAAQLGELAQICVGRGVLLVADEIYASLVYDGRRPVSVAALAPEFRDGAVVVNGASKSYAMTGWRIGYACGPHPLIKAMTDLQSQSTSNPTSIAQAAAVAAFRGPQECVGRMVGAFQERRDRMVELLEAIPGVRCHRPAGAFYTFPDVSAYCQSPKLGEQAGSQGLCEYLLEHQHIALVPGAPFGAEGHVRLSYATSMENIEKGLARLREGLFSLA